MKYKLAIFDWDGTLMDSTRKIVSAMQSAALDHQLPTPSDDAVKQIIGISLIPAIETLFDIQDNVLSQSMAQAYSAHYRRLDAQPCVLFDGVLQVLANLRARGTRLAIATGKGRPGLNKVLMQSNLQETFCTTRTADEALSKPSPDMLEQILFELAVDVSDAVMIGDTVHDMVMAERIGMARIGVDYGAHSANQLREHAPEAVISRCLQLLDHL